MVINKPPMGWNTWNTFGTDINEELVLKSAQFICDSGLKDAGYEYVIVDDCWSLKERDKNGKLVADPEKFPHGMKYLADKIHKMGLKFGMYSCAGTITCAGYPSSLDREWTDAETFASWGVDYLKYDYCFKPLNRQGEELYRAMGNALANCGRDILFAACSWGIDETHKWIRTTGANTWRSTEDIYDNWESIKKLLYHQLEVLPYGGKGCFNDMDMLVVGMKGKGLVGLGGCTPTQYRTHFAAWAMLQSPLIIGCNLTEMDEETLQVLTNKMLIDINQDEKCAQCSNIPITHIEDLHGISLVRALSNGDLAIGLFNTLDVSLTASITLNDCGLNFASGQTLELTNCWTGEKEIVKNGIIQKRLDAYDSVVYRAKIVKV